MLRQFDPRFDILPPPQKEIWSHLAAAPRLAFVLYGGTAVAFHLGHRQSVDFDFFRSEPLDKTQFREAFALLEDASVLQDAPDTLVVLAGQPSCRCEFLSSAGSGSAASATRC